MENLHCSSQYDRIIVVGHSLGSVIGCDILTHLWARHHDAHKSAAGNPVGYTALRTLESLAQQALDGGLNVNEYQTAQSAYLAELQDQGSNWLVTDFVTLGSPLAHASVLMVRDEQQFSRKKEEREFPTCPPALEEITVNRSRETKFTFKSDNVWVPHRHVPRERPESGNLFLGGKLRINTF